jgi:uncharacterized protein (TIGR03437 family)
MKSIALTGVLWLTGGVGACSQAPAVTPGGVTDAAGFASPVAPGALVSIFGNSLADGLAQADAIPLSTVLDKVSATFNGIPAPLLFVSAGQVNAQLPWNVLASGTTGTANLVVTNNGTKSAAVSVQVGPFSPGIFAVNNIAIAINSDGSLAAPVGAIPGITTHPVKVGDPNGLVILCTGLGAVNPPVTTGNNANDGQLHTAATTPMVMIGNVPVQVAFAGLSPLFVGVNQINIAVPAGTPTGDAVPLQIQVGGVTTSSAVTIAVSQPVSGTTLAAAAPYYTIGAGTISLGVSTNATVDFFLAGQIFRIRQDGLVKRVRAYVRAVSRHQTAFQVTFWRSNGANFDLIGRSENLQPQLTPLQVNTLTLVTPINVKEGDYVGFHLAGDGSDDSSFSGVNGVVSPTGTTQSMYFVRNAIPGVTAYNWTAQILYFSGGVVVPIGIDMDSPDIVAIGDSLTSGSPISGSLLNTQVAFAPNLAYPSLLGTTAQNMGVPGQTTGQMVSRFAVDVTAANPKIVIIEGGVNDIFAASSSPTIIANMQSMVSAAQAAGILPIVLTVNPWGPMNTIQSTSRDTINAALLAMASANCLVINQDSVLGVFRAGGPAGNLWNLNVHYDSGDGGHLNADGYAQVAKAIASAINARPRPRG